MNPYLIAGGLASIIIAFTVGFFYGTSYNEGQHAKEQVKVIIQDQKEANKIEAKDAKRQTEVRERIQIVEKHSPDWSAVVLPDPVSNGLCQSVACDP